LISLSEIRNQNFAIRTSPSELCNCASSELCNCASSKLCNCASSELCKFRTVQVQIFHYKRPIYTKNMIFPVWHDTTRHEMPSDTRIAYRRHAVLDGKKIETFFHPARHTLWDDAVQHLGVVSCRVVPYGEKSYFV
jgi:hypothetical protein